MVTVLDHQARKRIYNHILTHPGISYTTLKNILDLPDGTLRYHIEYLEKAQRILPDIENGKRCYYPFQNEFVDTQILDDRPQFHRFTEIQQNILSAIKRQPGITQKELQRRTNLGRFTIRYNIKKFIDMGYIRSTNSEKYVRYEYMTDELLRHEVLIRLTMKLINNEISEAEYLKLKGKLIDK
jgi:predicted transcriptional regulator